MPSDPEWEAKVKRETRVFDAVGERIAKLNDAVGGGLTYFQVFVVFVGGEFLLGFIRGGGSLSTVRAWLIVGGPVGVSMLGLWLIAQRSRWAPAFWITSLLAALAATFYIFSAAPETRSGMPMLVWALGFWLLYWLRSKRIKREFARKT